MKCRYCGQPFDPDDDWHVSHRLTRHCSHGCKYAEELPVSHHGRSHVTMDALPPLLATNAPHPIDIMEPDKADDMPEYTCRFAGALRMIASLDVKDRELVMYLLAHPYGSLSAYARQVGVSVQAISARLYRLCRKHPVFAALQRKRS